MGAVSMVVLVVLVVLVLVVVVANTMRMTRRRMRPRSDTWVSSWWWWWWWWWYRVSGWGWDSGVRAGEKELAVRALLVKASAEWRALHNRMDR